MAETLPLRDSFVTLPAGTLLTYVQHSSRDLRRVVVAHQGEQYVISSATWQGAEIVNESGLYEDS